MKIIIINSPLFRDKNSRYDEDSLPPIGLGLIATSLKENGFNVELLDAVALKTPLNELIEKVNNEKPEFICTNVFTTNLELVKEFVESVNYKAHFIIGGLSTGSLWEEIFKWKSDNQIDVVHGDGELIITDIVLGPLKQAASNEDGNRRFFKIDNQSIYFVKEISKEKLKRAFFVNEPIVNLFGQIEANIVTSRGCIYNCAFCAAASSLNRDFGTREKNTSSIISEIQYLLNFYPHLQSIRVLDDLFLKNAVIVNKAIEVFSSFKLQWRSMAHVQTFKGVDESTIKSLKKSGCNELFIGIESGSPKILKQIHKTQDLEVIKQNLSSLLRNGINIKGYFIYGFPDETVQDMEMTYFLAEYLKDVSVKYGSQFRASVFQFRPYHGTELYHRLEEQMGNKTFSHVSSVEPNDELSERVGRIQFNFHSGNYAQSDLKTVHDFIYKTTSLNSRVYLPPDGQHKNSFKSNTTVQ